MVVSSTRLAGAALAALSVTLGCASHDEASTADTGKASETGLVTCVGDPRATPYQPGLERTSATGAFRVRFVSAKPSSPTVGINSWVVAVFDAKGAPVVDAKFPARADWGAWPNGVWLFMPHHGHGASSAPTITANGDGTYTIGDIDFMMPGLWELTLRIEKTVIDDVTVGFCVSG